MKPGVHAGVSETFDAQHRLLGGAEHRVGLVVELTLNKVDMKLTVYHSLSYSIVPSYDISFIIYGKIYDL